jgi:hypothetical protein
MPKEHAELINRIFRLLEKNSNYLIQELGEEPKINKTFLTEYLKAVGNQKYARLERRGFAKFILNEYNVR